MYGPPEDVEGECNARLYIGDDYGDNTATMRCGLPAGHTGEHSEVYKVPEEGTVRIYWDFDERVKR